MKKLVAIIMMTLGLTIGLSFGTPLANASSWHSGTPGFLYNKRYRPNNSTKEPMMWGNKTHFHIDYTQDRPNAVHPTWKYSHHVYTIRSTTYWITSSGHKEVSEYFFVKVKRINSKKIFTRIGQSEKLSQKPNYYLKYTMYCY
ncbi:hypothetical protein [Lentilactobacillus parakefiri]|uniref:Uncharacterized protein n=1 Tax=Lentilactobacillus parakefiri TaxID=152332 RepID=A0A224VHT1_9LACO|nr:hypothetical protein [Lentilactobacillus parakefiri]KRL66659.1 hypothetical protein FD08_GL001973 [Lentilactobacillus parakefiri DSM 10551]TDG91687.1 hypothetical protein C5L28_000259 [Lentilactobacillus parakefiri]GAW72061.1 hypothetical protein LPKJCM_01169 [Lentilactobacillus parakefiri]